MPPSPHGVRDYLVTYLRQVGYQVADDGTPVEGAAPPSATGWARPIDTPLPAPATAELPTAKVLLTVWRSRVLTRPVSWDREDDIEEEIEGPNEMLERLPRDEVEQALASWGFRPASAADGTGQDDCSLVWEHPGHDILADVFGSGAHNDGTIRTIEVAVARGRPAAVERLRRQVHQLAERLDAAILQSSL